MYVKVSIDRDNCVNFQHSPHFGEGHFVKPRRLYSPITAALRSGFKLPLYGFGSS